jgi:hypothetical protein
MKIVFVAIGWENISLQALSAVLKQHGHDVELVYDQALFDDKNYLCIKWLARLLDQKDKVLQRIIELQPDLVGFSVQTVQYREMLELVRELKKRYRVPVIFGGIHPHSAPDEVLRSDDPTVDVICLGEGEYPLLELVESMARGRLDYSVRNLWFRLEGGEIIRNGRRPVIHDLDSLPTIDKELFAPHVPIKYSYLATPSRGCPFDCSYCSLSFLGKDALTLSAPRCRERSVDSLIEEIKDHIAKYKSAWIDFRQPVMATRESWCVEFFERYRKEIGIPFRCFSHPLLITEASVRAMRDAGCFAIQIGIECWDEEIRNLVINRKESNEQIRKAADILERLRQPYAFDYILGLPRLPKTLPDGTTAPLSEEETLASYKEELMGFAEFITPLRHCYRIAPFMIAYMPGTALIEHGLRAGDLSENEVERLKNGFHDNYMSGGSIVINPRRLRLLNGYRVLFRLMCFLGPAAKKKLLDLKAYRFFWTLPFRLLISVLDLLIAARDKDATTYVRNYGWWFMKRFDPAYHLSYFKKKTPFPEIGTPFELPKDGVLGSKGDSGWQRPDAKH